MRDQAVVAVEDDEAFRNALDRVAQQRLGLLRAAKGLHDAGLGRHPLGDVPLDADDAGDLTLLIVHRRVCHRGPADRVIFTLDARDPVGDGRPGREYFPLLLLDFARALRREEVPGPFPPPTPEGPQFPM